MWKGLEVMLKYRTRNNYLNGYYLFGRLFDKTMCGPLTPENGMPSLAHEAPTEQNT